MMGAPGGSVGSRGQRDMDKEGLEETKRRTAEEVEFAMVGGRSQQDALHTHTLGQSYMQFSLIRKG